ncbi:MAG: hypothetical protein LBQ56_05835 [Synergistaceae bacterium]|nr:hypothetical protein [Synergistaceae bacterium]
MMKSNIVSPEPDRMRRKAMAALKYAGNIMLGRKNSSEALKEYRAESDRIESERELDKYRKY